MAIFDGIWQAIGQVLQEIGSRIVSVFLAMLMLGAMMCDDVWGGGPPYTAREAQNVVTQQTGVSAHGNVTAKDDSHDGFHGDGETRITIVYDKDIFTEVPEHWTPLPLSEDAANVHALCENVWTSGEVFYNETRNVTNGYYFFRDDGYLEHGDDPYSAAEVLGRYSYNFVFAIYDADTFTLYYYELDT